jgi:hypothetical protein
MFLIILLIIAANNLLIRLVNYKDVRVILWN